MLRLTIGTRDEGTPLRARIEEKIRALIESTIDTRAKEKSGITIEETPLTDDLTQLTIAFSGSDSALLSRTRIGGPGPNGASGADRDRFLRFVVAHALTEMILAEYEPKMIEKFVRDHRPVYGDVIVQDMFQRCQELLDSAGLPGFFDRDHIVHKIMDYLAEDTALNVDGFIRFRLHDYTEGLADAVLQVIDDYEAEEEREEFVALLRDYIADTSIGMQTAHVLPRGGDRLIIVNQNGEAFQEVDGEGLYWPDEEETWDPDEVWDNELSWTDREEWLVSSLVAIAPSRIVIHLSRREHMDMMQDVFGGRLVFCGGCSRCMHLREGSTY